VGRLPERERDLAAVEELLQHHGGVLLIEGRAGIGKTSLVEAACSRADELGQEVLRARGSELESGFAFGLVRQLFERRLASAAEGERAALLAGPAAAVRPLLTGEAPSLYSRGRFANISRIGRADVRSKARGPRGRQTVHPSCSQLSKTNERQFPPTRSSPPLTSAARWRGSASRSSSRAS